MTDNISRPADRRRIILGAIGLITVSIVVLLGYRFLVADYRWNGSRAGKGFEPPLPELFAAIKAGDLARVSALIEAGADVNHEEQYFGTPLRMAAASGQVAVLEYLIAHGAVITGPAGSSALYGAAGNGHVKAIQLLRSRGVPLDNDHGQVLITAIDGGHLDVVKYFIEAEGVEVNSSLIHDWTPLVYAVRKHQTAIADYLLKRGAAVEVTVSVGVPPGSSPLSIAAESGFSDIVELLVRAGADPNAMAGHGWTALMNAAAAGQLETVKKLVALGADIHQVVSPGERGGTTAVGLAAAGGAGEVEVEVTGDGHDEIVEYLLDQGAKVDTRDQGGTTPLIFAARRGARELVGKLLARGAEINAFSEARGTALMQAAAIGDTELVRLLLDRGAQTRVVIPEDQDRRFPEVHTDALTAAAAGDHPEVIRMLLARGAVPGIGAVAVAIPGHQIDISIIRDLFDAGAKITSDNQGAHLLREAINYNRLEIMALLIEHGAKVRGGLEGGGTDDVLSCAATEENIELVKLLLAHGAVVNSHGSGGYTPLMAAAGCGRLDTVKLFVEQYGADVNARNNSGVTALMMGAERASADVVKYLLERGADTSARDSDNRTALHYAMDQCDYRTSAALVAAGVDVNCRVWSQRRNEHGETALFRAVGLGNRQVTELLVEAGTDLSIRNNAGKTVLDVAATRQHLEGIHEYLRSVAEKQPRRSNAGH